jgi:hypothetical protein
MPKLRNVLAGNMLKEQSFKASVISSGALNAWTNRRLTFLLPMQGNGEQGRDYEIFEGEGQSWVIVGNTFNLTHVNWQCDQRPNGDPIVWLLTDDPNSPLKGKTGCKACRLNGDTVWWTEKCGAIARKDWTQEKCGSRLYIKSCDE